MTPENDPAASTTEANRAVMTEFARLMYDERNPAAAFEKHVSPDYIQHNPMATDGREAAVSFLTPLYTAEGARFDVQRMLVDGDLAAIHLRAQPVGRGTLAIVDVYRLVDGVIVEHWDAIQPMPETAANDHPMF